MSTPNVRKQAIAAIAAQSTAEATVDYIQQPITEVFGINVFSDAVMRARLPKATYKALKRTIEFGEPLDASVADMVAAAMKDWAISKGATHFTHWFQPLTGLTAEKHDSFIAPTAEGRALRGILRQRADQGRAGCLLLPLRRHSRHRLKPAATPPGMPPRRPFLKDNVNGNTLCIPTAFFSYTGEALDKKMPLLRSIEALSKQAVRVLRLFGNDDGDARVLPRSAPSRNISSSTSGSICSART